jgi:acetyltransferase-like isoleucine patch superfamily enzyme
MKHKFLLLYAWLVRILLIWLPDQPLIMRMRGFIYGLAMKRAGANFQVSSNVIIKGLNNFTVGKDVYLAPGVIINAIVEISLNDEVMIGFNSVLVSGNHTCLNRSFRFGPSLTSIITVESGSWIGSNCTLMPGSALGQCSVLAANSALTTVVPDFTVFGGVPAKFIKVVNV